MSRLITVFLLTASLLPSSPTVASETASRPIRQTELLALVAGNVLPENIVNEVHARGIAFRMDDAFRAQLKTAGTAPAILDALNLAKAPAQTAPADKPDPVLLQHIAAAAKLMKDKRYEEAADELTGTLRGNFEKFEMGFVMGELLRQQENWVQAAAVYAEVLRQDPNFPEAHTKLSYVLYHCGDMEGALREAKTALARTPQNAEAHMYAGIALDTPGKFDAALAEYKEALRLKPDYAQAHYSLGVSLYEHGDKAGSIAEYRKALALNPSHINARYNLANLLKETGDLDGAIREFREAKRSGPNRFDVRMNLSNALIDANMTPQAILELRELEIMAPNSAMCHQALGHALHLVSDFKEAEKEFGTAAELDPSEPGIHVGLGVVQEDQNHYEAALREYRRAEELDEDSAYAHRNAGRVLLAMKNSDGALKELKLAENLIPGDPYTHQYYAQALQLSGDLNAAVGEFKESLALDGKQVDVRLDLAAALEKKGDWVAALDQYKQAALAESFDPTTIRPGTAFRVYDAPKKYTAAKERFDRYIASLRKAGKSSQAAQLEKQLRDSQSAKNATDKLDELMETGLQALKERRFDESERDYKQALQIAETLQPHDVRLATTLGHLGNLAAFRSDFTSAGALFERQLKAAEELPGPQVPTAVTAPLTSLAMNALAQRDFPAAQKFVQRALDVNAKFYGENSLGVADMLSVMAGVYLSQGDYDKAEPYVLQAVDIEAKLYNYDPRYGGIELRMLMMLCTVYDKWGKADKLESCDHRLIAILDKDAGPDTRLLETTLEREAKTLRTLGRSEEADKTEQRLKSLKPTAAANPN